jgi:arabinosaccharide transport system substrate-binding protein
MKRVNLKSCWCVFILCVLIAVLVAGCGSGREVAGVDTPVIAGGQELEETHITLWAFAQTHANFFEWAMEEFEQTHPGTSFTLEVMDSLADRLSIVIMAGGEGSPDLVDIEQGMFPRFMLPDMLRFVPLNDFLVRDNLLDDLVEARLSLYEVDGIYFGIEHALCPVTMAYRPDLFELYDIPIPETWDEYLSAALQFREHEIYITTGADMHNSVPSLMFVMQRAAGMDFVGPGATINVVPSVINIIEDIKNMQLDGRMFAFTEGSDRWNMIRQDRVATEFFADWGMGWLRDNVPEQEGMWRVRPLPEYRPGASRVSVWGGTGLTMMEFSQIDRDFLWEFIRFAMIDRESNIVSFDMINLYPPVHSAMPYVNFPVDYYGGQIIGELYQELAPEIPRQNQAFWRPAWDDAINFHLFDLMIGNITVQEMLDTVVETTEQFIADNS